MRVYNVPASAPFLRTLFEALVDGRLIPGFEMRSTPERLAQATLYLPTRRAGRLARDIFLDILDADAAVLPRIVTLGDIDEEDLAFAQAAEPMPSDDLDIPLALDGLPRRLMLARLIGAWARQLKPEDPTQAPLVVGGPVSTLSLADDLARLMDDMATRGVDWNALGNGLVPDAHDRYWQLTLQFLNIAAKVWPPVLAERGLIDPAARRDLLISAETARLATHRDGPVIAAGSTGSMPSTARLLHAIAQLPDGAVVLPGLDMDLDDSAWGLIGGSDDAPAASNHPQFALHGLLKRFGIERRDVATLGVATAQGRELLTSEAMRPSNASADWHRRLVEPDVAVHVASGMTRLSVVAADTSETEALAIAVAMREAHELGKSAALVTPDRALARRVIAALGRWNLTFDDSGGDVLPDTSVGLLARSIATAAAEQFAPVPLLALLKHPLLRLGRAEGGWQRAIETLELALLRGTRPAAGNVGLVAGLADLREQISRSSRDEPITLHRSDPRLRLDDTALDDAGALIVALAEALMPLDSINLSGGLDFSDMARRHRAAINLVGRDADGQIVAFDGAAGNSLLAAFDDLETTTPISGLDVSLRDYPDLFRLAFGDRVVRRLQLADATLRIYGPLEARLTQSDRVILGGLVESVWPPAPRIDPWLSRPMRHQLGLDLPERRIGLSAHDFAQLLGADEVILTHAAKVSGAPAVASRFLHRLEAVAGKARWDDALARGQFYLDCAHALDAPEKVTPIAQPKPTPPRDARPTRLSVTAIEDWLRDPYSIYARYILNLAPLDEVDMPLSAADRGSAIHEALGDFTEQFPASLPANAAAELRAIGVTHFAPLMVRPEAKALWWPRFLRITDWFAGWERDRRLNVAGIDAEQRGELTIPLTDGRRFVLSAYADRIERRTDRTYAIVDYKTGAPPTGKQVRLGLSPQLTLEAAILRAGGFIGIPAGSSVSELVYVRLSGNNPPGQEIVLKLKHDGDPAPLFPDDVADEALAKLTDLVRRFENDATPYTSLSLSMWANRYGRYDDLARIKEWSAAGDEEDT